MDYPSNPTDTPHPLTPAGQAALDALVDAGWDPDRIARADSGPTLGADAGRVLGFLSLLGQRATHTDPEHRATLIDVTMARVLRDRAADAGAAEPELCEADQRALDHWMMDRDAAVGGAGEHAVRARKHAALASLVTGRKPEADGARTPLVDRTFAACMAGEAPVYEMNRRGGFRGVRAADAASVAAMLFIGASVLWPVMASVRDNARRLACSGNLNSVGQGMGLYAFANRDQLPVATASLGGGKWWEVGSDRASNSANLFHLASTGFSKLTDMACPGNPTACVNANDAGLADWKSIDNVSYSYRIMFGPQHPEWNQGGRVVVLSDRSPVVLRAVRGEPINPWENSPNHGSKGQKVLFSDGSSAWFRTPELDNRDNIWLPRPIEEALGRVTGREVRLEGTEFPASAEDAFVGP